MRVFILVSLALQILGLPTCAQSPEVQFDHLSTQQGLSHATVNCLLQDRQGFMWFGTKDGLNRYDGYNFLLFEHQPTAKNSLSDNTIQALCQDHTGTLWIGTSHGLNQFDLRTQTFTLFDLHTKKGSGDNNITAIYEDRAHTLWVGSMEGLSRFDTASRSFILYEHQPRQDAWAFNAIHTIYEDRAGTLWLGTNQGISSFNRQTGTFTRFPPPAPATVGLAFPNAVKALCEDRAGVLWLGTTDNGLQAFDRTSHSFLLYRHNPRDARSLSSNAILALCEDAFGRLWVATRYGGLNRLETRSGTFTRYEYQPDNAASLSSNSLICLYADRFQVLWIGTYAAGLNKVDLLRKHIAHFSHTPGHGESMRDNYVYSLQATADGTVWIGNRTGLDKLDRKSGQYTHYTYNLSFSQKPITTLCLYEDRSASLWIGLAGGGLKKFDLVSQQFTTYLNDVADSTSLSHNYVKAICEDKHGALWIGTLNGLCRFDRPLNRFTTYKPALTRTPRFDINCLIMDHAGWLWLATSHDGLIRFDPATHSFTAYDFRGQAEVTNRETNVSYVYEDHSGGVWASLKEGGLYHQNGKTARFTLVTKPAELSKTVISGMLEDQRGNLWLSTRKSGLLKFNPSTQALHGYDASDGLQGNEFNRALCQSTTGEMYFGGNNGFNAFYPDSIRDNPYAPPVVITGFKVFDKPRSFAEGVIELPYSDNFFSFDFAALHYALPEKNRYAYRLESFDQEWRQAGSRRYASYTNLDPGEYVFRVKATNNDGVWNERGTSIKLLITPPFWKTWWFRGSGAVLILALAWAAHQTRTRQITARNRVLEAKVHERTQQIEQQKEEIASQRDTLQLFNQEISHQNEVLEQKVEERTQELQTSNEELRQNLEITVGLNTKLVEQENFLSSILDQTPFSTSIADATGTSIRINQSFLALFGVEDLREVVGKYNIFQDPTFIGQPFYPAIESVFTEGQIARFELQYDLGRGGQGNNHAGKQVSLVVTIFPIKDSSGKVVNAVVQHEDITERKKAEEALQSTNQELNKINVDLDNFVYMASHDLKAPIANLEGLASILIRRLELKLDEPDLEMMKMISLSTAKLKSTVLDLTEITKVQKGIDDTMDSVSFEEVFIDIQENIISLKEESGAVISTDFAVERIQYARKNLRSIMYNLLANALKYCSPERTPRITIKTRQLPQYVLLSVEDNGLGIAAHQLHKLFTMFQRLHTHVEGTGIGLYIIKRIIENNGGKIEVESEEGKGTTFKVFFKEEGEA